MGTVFFSSDLHLGHHKILTLGKGRPFIHTDEMAETILDRFNSKIKSSDTLYLLGDVGWHSYDWSQWLSRLKTKQIHLIRGNHDHSESIKRASHLFRSVSDLKEIKIGGYPSIVLCHYPMRYWHHCYNGTYHLFGHVHNQLDSDWGRSMDVGVDTNNFYPWVLEEVHQILQHRPIEYDHHELKERKEKELNHSQPY